MSQQKNRGLNGKLLLGAGIGGGILVLIVIFIAALFGVDLDELYIGLGVHTPIGNNADFFGTFNGATVSYMGGAGVDSVSIDPSAPGTD